MGDQCPATRRYAAPDSGEMRGLQCKYTSGHEGEHAADPGTGSGDIFWPQDDTDVIVRVGDRATGDQLRQMSAMVDAAMANPRRWVHGP